MMIERIPTLKSDQRPLYVQVSDALSELIRAKTYIPGDKLPSEDELAIQLGVSRPTLRVAIGYLESQGLLQRRRGIGTFITNSIEKHVDGEGLELIETVCELAERIGLSCERVHWHIESCLTDEKLADLLKSSVNVPSIYARYAFKLNGDLYAFFESWVLATYLDINELKAFPEKGLLDYLWQRTPDVFSSTETKVYARVADDKMNRWLGIPVGTPLLHMEELFILENGQPFVYNLKYFDTSIMHFYMSRRFPKKLSEVKGR